MASDHYEDRRNEATKWLIGLSRWDKRIQIAEACGAVWHKVPDYKPVPGFSADENKYQLSLHPSELLCFRSPNFERISLPFYHKCGRALGSDIPEYLEDLNAMHDAEKVIYLWRLEWLYAATIREVNCRDHGFVRPYALLHATSLQRADAFLLALHVHRAELTPPSSR